MWKIVFISNINHYHNTHLECVICYFHFGHCHNLGKFVQINKNCLGLCPKTDMITARETEMQLMLIVTDQGRSYPYTRYTRAYLKKLCRKKIK